MNRAELAGRIDHTLLKADATIAQVEALCDEALRYACAAACVNGVHVARVAERLAGSKVRTCAVAGFPLGAVASKAKVAEARAAIDDGAIEIDMVLDIGAIKDGDDARAARDVEAVVRAAGAVPVKVILETCLLDRDQKARAARLVLDAGAAFLKTSTGFSTGGATVEDVRLLRELAGERARVKASGGIRDLKTALAMIEAGADRLGMSATVSVLDALAP